MRALAFIALCAAGGCVTPVGEQCRGCTVVDAMHPRLPAVKPGTERLFVLVPGMLGYGWEWNGPVARLRAARGVDFVVFWWKPSGSLDRAARELDDVLTRLVAAAPA